MNFINFGLEDEGTENETPKTGDDINLNPNEAEQAAQAIENQDSTEPAKVLQVANYKEELAILQNQADNGQTGDKDQDNTDGNNENQDGNDTPDADTSTENEETQTDEGEENQNSEDEEEPEDPPPADAEMGEEAPGKTDGEVAQEQFILEGHKSVAQALESIQVMGKYHDYISKRSDLSGLSPLAAKNISTAFEHHANLCGWQKPVTGMPALESFGSYSASLVATGELKIAIEGFLDTVWTAIKKFFKSIWTWIMDVLTPKKAATTVPADRATRDKAMRELEATNAKLLKTIESIDRAREKDQARKDEAELSRLRQEAREREAKLGQRIAAQLFKTSDKGSFSEISLNARQMAETIEATVKMAKALAGIMTAAGSGALTGKVVRASDVGIQKNSIAGITFNQLNRANQGVTLEAITDEIMGGIGARFVFAGTDTEAVSKTKGLNRALQELGHQGFKMVGVKEKSGFPSRMPTLDQSDVAHIRKIAQEVDSSYKSLNMVQETVTKMASLIKSQTEGSEPPTWRNLSKEQISTLQMQLNLVGLLETNLVAGYKSTSDFVNNFRNGYIRMAAMIAPE